MRHKTIHRPNFLRKSFSCILSRTFLFYRFLCSKTKSIRKLFNEDHFRFRDNVDKLYRRLCSRTTSTDEGLRKYSRRNKQERWKSFEIVEPRFHWFLDIDPPLIRTQRINDDKKRLVSFVYFVMKTKLENGRVELTCFSFSWIKFPSRLKLSRSDADTTKMIRSVDSIKL